MCLDGYMNIALENAQEWSGAALKQSYGEIFIRGNNGTHYSLYFILLITSLSFIYTSHKLIICIKSIQSSLVG